MTIGPPTRPSLLLRLRDPRDQQAWSEFVDLYGRVVFRFLERRGLQEVDALDVMQDTFRSVAGAISSFEYLPAQGSFRGWLLTVTQNHLRSFLRRRARRPVVTGGEGEVWDQLAGDDPEAGEIWEEQWRREVFTRACAHVQAATRPDHWTAFARTAVSGHRPQQVAEELGLPVAAVYLAKSRVLAKLRAFIEELESELERE